jgi:cell fate (sporulation/competence/biofilm development) regulator YmcA (YheA/YmcA/DUF963 family)
MTHKESLIQLIQNTPEVIRYQQLEQLIMNDVILKEKMNHLKSMQKQLVHAKELGHVLNKSHFESKVTEAENELANYPKMTEYLSLQSLINETLQEMMHIIESQLDEDILNNEKGR